MNYTNLAYFCYLPIVIGLTIWVANQLLKNSIIFYKEIFGGKDDQANSINKLLQVGFYLLAIGFAFNRLKIKGTRKYIDGIWQSVPLTGLQELMEVLSGKIGGFVILLGVMLFINVLLVLGMRSKKLKREQVEKWKIQRVNPKTTH